MNIADIREKCKAAVGRLPKDAVVLLVLILASSASFGLGFSAGQDASRQGQGSQSLTVASTTARFVASENGTRYYPVSCAGAARISAANKLWFATAAAATAAGYAPASGCAKQ